MKNSLGIYSNIINFLKIIGINIYNLIAKIQ